MQQEGQESLVEAVRLVAAWPSPCFPFPPLPTLVQEVEIRSRGKETPSSAQDRQWDVSYSPTEGHANSWWTVSE